MISVRQRSFIRTMQDRYNSRFNRRILADLVLMARSNSDFTIGNRLICCADFGNGEKLCFCLFQASFEDLRRSTCLFLYFPGFQCGSLHMESAKLGWVLSLDQQSQFGRKSAAYKCDLCAFFGHITMAKKNQTAAVKWVDFGFNYWRWARWGSSWSP